MCKAEKVIPKPSGTKWEFPGSSHIEACELVPLCQFTDSDRREEPLAQLGSEIHTFRNMAATDVDIFSVSAL